MNTNEKTGRTIWDFFSENRTGFFVVLITIIACIFWLIKSGITVKAGPIELSNKPDTVFVKDTIPHVPEPSKTKHFRKEEPQSKEHKKTVNKIDHTGDNSNNAIVDGDGNTVLTGDNSIIYQNDLDKMTPSLILLRMLPFTAANILPEIKGVFRKDFPFHYYFEFSYDSKLKRDYIGVVTDLEIEHNINFCFLGSGSGSFQTFFDGRNEKNIIAAKLDNPIKNNYYVYVSAKSEMPNMLNHLFIDVDGIKYQLKK